VVDRRIIERNRPTVLPWHEVRVREVFARGPVGGNLQPHLAVARIPEQLPGSTPVSLLSWTNHRRTRPCWALFCSASKGAPVDRPPFGRHVFAVVVDVCISESAPRRPVGEATMFRSYLDRRPSRPERDVRMSAGIVWAGRRSQPSWQVSARPVGDSTAYLAGRARVETVVAPGSASGCSG
jgi:hypothetical protein